MSKTCLVLLLSLIMSSCAGTMQTARTNGQGNFQVGIEPGVIAYEIDREAGGEPGPRVGNVEYFPYLNLSGRYGVAERVDLGLRLSVFEYEFQTKVMITSPEDLDSVAVSVAPSVVYSAGALITAPVKVIVGIPVGRHELVVAPHALVSFQRGIRSFGGGGSVGFALKLEDVTLLPELAITTPFTDLSKYLHFNVGVGILFGGR